MNLFLLITIIFRTKSLRILNPQIQIFNETLPTYDFVRQSQEIIQIPYGAYPGIFAIDLHKRINGEIDHQSINLGDFEKIEEEELQEEGCFAIQRNIEISMKLKLWLDKTGLTQYKYFTDLALVEQDRKAFIVRNDFIVYSVNLNPGLYGMYLNNEQSSFANILNYDENNDDYHPFLIKEQNSQKIYVFTTIGGVSFESNQIINQEIIFKLESEIQKRDRIFSIHYNEKNKLIFVACGYEGIDIYKIENNNIKFIKQYSIENIGNPYTQIIDVNSDGQDKLYILDQEQGLKFYQINQDLSIKYLFLIQITNAQSFDFYKNTFFIVAKTVNKQDYAIEIFVNQINYDYYINNYYIDEMTINDINVYDNYAILIGDDGHKIIYHSIYSGFLNEDLISHTSFYQPNLIKTKEYEFDNKQQSNIRIIAGIAKYEFQLININMNMPSVFCQINEVGKNQYYVKINSTNCPEKNALKSIYYQFQLCNSSQSFTLTTTELPGNYHSYAYYTITIYILIILIIWFIVICFYLSKNWGYKLKYLLWRKKIVDATAPYNENFDVKEQELPTQQK